MKSLQTLGTPGHPMTGGTALFQEFPAWLGYDRVRTLPRLIDVALPVADRSVPVRMESFLDPLI